MKLTGKLRQAGKTCPKKGKWLVDKAESGSLNRGHQEKQFLTTRNPENKKG